MGQAKCFVGFVATQLGNEGEGGRGGGEAGGGRGGSMKGVTVAPLFPTLKPSFLFGFHSVNHLTKFLVLPHLWRAVFMIIQTEDNRNVTTWKSRLVTAFQPAELATGAGLEYNVCLRLTTINTPKKAWR